MEVPTYSIKTHVDDDEENDFIKYIKRGDTLKRSNAAKHDSGKCNKSCCSWRACCISTCATWAITSIAAAVTLGVLIANHYITVTSVWTDGNVLEPLSADNCTSTAF